MLPTAAALMAAMTVLGACGSSTPDDVIDRETFIDAYVELRVAALDTDSQRVAAADREAILQRLGVTEDDLLRFAEVHGGELEYMREVWNEVELRLDQPSDPTPAENGEEPEGADAEGEAGDEEDAEDGGGSGAQGGGS
ncbi:MAG: hypothetical protein R3304_11625 [Longimicrobiales bacterium]|nr:hypothetical protein [Longimicrobiales bacterium]